MQLSTLSNIKLRILSSIIAITILCSTLLLDNKLYITAIIYIIFSLAILEWGNLCLLSMKRNILNLVYFLIFTEVIDFYLMDIYIHVIGAIVWAIALILMLFSKKWNLLSAEVKSIVGIVLISFSLLSTRMLVGTGFNYIISSLSLVWAVDIFGFIIGKNFGKRPLAPLISPNKTVEGFYGSCLGTLFISITWILWIDPFLATSPSLYSTLWRHLSGISLALIIFLVLICVAGDLFESAMKRSARVKDSGKFFPGHGGILDRLDSMLPSMPFFMLIYTYFESHV